MLRDLTKLPLSSWGRHELEAEVKRLREQQLPEELEKRVAALELTGGPCDACKGSGRHAEGLGACEWCWGTGHRKKMVETLIQRLAKAENSAQEARRKADDHRRQRDSLADQLKPAALAHQFETSSGRRKE